jgi:uncharacterized protein
MHRSFVHLELNTGDTDAARDFYRQVFQWDFEDIPMVDGSKYTQIRPPTGLMGGMQAKLGPNAPTAWMPYVGVQSVEDTVARVVQAGGVVVEPYQPVPGFGALAIVEDPTGAPFGLWETAMPMPAEDAASGGEAADEGDVATAEPSEPRAKKAAKRQAKKAAKKTAAKKTAAKKPAAKKTAAKTPEPEPKAEAKTAPTAKKRVPSAKKATTGKKSAPPAKKATTGKKSAPPAKKKAAAKKATTTGKKSAPPAKKTGKKKAATKTASTTAKKSAPAKKKTARGRKGKR